MLQPQLFVDTTLIHYLFKYLSFHICVEIFINELDVLFLLVTIIYVLL